VVLRSLKLCFIRCSSAVLTAVGLYSLQWCYTKCSNGIFAAVVLHSLQWCYIECAGAVLAAKKLSDYLVFPLGQTVRGVKLYTHPSYSARLRVNDGSDLDKLFGALGD